MSILIPVCPTGCSSEVFPVDFDPCSPKVFFGEIEHIYIANGDAAPFTDVESLAEWTARISEDSADPDAIRDLTVIADLPAATTEEIVISLGRKVYSPATHMINVEIDDISDLTYEFARSTSCNQQYRIWYATESHIFGGTDGHLATVNLRSQIERGQKSVNKLVGTISWDFRYDSERNDNPFATT